MGVIKTAASWIMGLLSGFIGAVWRAVLVVLDLLVSWVVMAIGVVVEFVMILLLGLLSLLAALLPDALNPEHAAIQGGVNVVAAANQYVPLTEGLALLAIWAAIFTGIGVYKLVKLLNPLGGG